MTWCCTNFSPDQVVSLGAVGKEYRLGCFLEDYATSSARGPSANSCRWLIYTALGHLAPVKLVPQGYQIRGFPKEIPLPSLSGDLGKGYEFNQTWKGFHHCSIRDSWNFCRGSERFLTLAFKRDTQLASMS